MHKGPSASSTIKTGYNFNINLLYLVSEQAPTSSGGKWRCAHVFSEGWRKCLGGIFVWQMQLRGRVLGSSQCRSQGIWTSDVDLDGHLKCIAYGGPLLTKLEKKKCVFCWAGYELFFHWFTACFVSWVLRVHPEQIQNHWKFRVRKGTESLNSSYPALH